ncbi:hypothetical protein ACVWZZ_008439 [Bradyrhizobium sp. LM6.10]
MPGTGYRARLRRSITTWVETWSRSSGGFRLMYMMPRLDVAPPGPPPLPTVEPMPATAGSCITMSASRCCRLSIDWNEMSAEARVAPMTKPESSVGK